MLGVERQLIGEARVRLHEFFLKNGWDRRDVEKRIRRYAIEKLENIVEDAAMKEIVTRTIQSTSLDEAFPDVN